MPRSGGKRGPKTGGRRRSKTIYTSFEELPIALDVETAADLLQLSPDYVYGAVDRGEIPAIKAGPGGKIRINKYALFQRWGVRFEALTMQITDTGGSPAKPATPSTGGASATG